jgi:hypothetical protein
MAFSRAVVATFKATKAADIERLARTSLALARALRLTPINRTHPEKLGRYMANKQLSYYQRMEMSDAAEN